MMQGPDAIASAVLHQFGKLPAKRRLQTRDDGVRQWVPLSGIVAEHKDGLLTCLALASGMKCLPASQLRSARGRILHDWHAEILAIRAFNYFLLQECQAMRAGGKDSPYVRRRRHDGQGKQPFIWNEEIALHMYCSEAPCGDASMELTMSAQDDASPWETPLPPHLMESRAASSADPDLLLLGRACFDRLGIVRRKPSRADAPPTLSKSCSDKLALKQCTSLLSSSTSLLLSPRAVYLQSVVLPESQYSAVAFDRCFSPNGRMRSLKDAPRTWGDDGYDFCPFQGRTTRLEFEYSRPARGPDAAQDTKSFVASNLASAWTANGLSENIVGGVLQGRKQSDPRGGSALSRASMWLLLLSIWRSLGDTGTRSGTALDRYTPAKESSLLAGRRKVKADVRRQALKGWVRNSGDDDF